MMAYRKRSVSLLSQSARSSQNGKAVLTACFVLSEIYFQFSVADDIVCKWSGVAVRLLQNKMNDL